MRALALLALVLIAVACGSEPAPSCGAPGLVRACACVGGAAGAQECSPGGAWSVCACPDASPGLGDAAGDAQLGDAGTDALDASPAADADRRDSSIDAPAEVGPGVPADSLSDAVDATDDLSFQSMGDAADLSGPMPLAQRLDHVEIWQSIDGAPFVPVSGMCNDMRARVFVRTPDVRATYVYSPPGAVSSNALRCTNGLDWGDNRATYEYGGFYYNPPTGPARVARSNLHFIGNIPPRVCDSENPARRVEVYAFGCPVI